MRWRITVAMILLVAGTLVATVVATTVLTERVSFTNARQDLATEARAITAEASTAQRRGVLGLLRRVAGLEGASIPYLRPDGTFTGRLPAGLDPDDLDLARLEAGKPVSGHIGSLVYAAASVRISTALAHARKPHTGKLLIPKGYRLVVVLTRRARSPGGLAYFILIAAAAFVAAALVATALSRRMASSLRHVAATTERIAAGDLSARVGLNPHDAKEIASLGQAINSMSESLQRARNQERQFLMSVSHELRTPLTSIRGYADAIADGTATDTSAALRIIENEAGRLDRLVRDLLDLARLDAQRFSLHMATIDAADVVYQAVLAHRPLLTQEGLSIEVELPKPSKLEVWADADRLGQVVANLLENAFKYARTAISVSVSTNHDGYVAIAVQDDGPGVGPEDLERIFDRHFSATPAPSRKAGSGLGLAIVAELVRAMGGAVRAYSPLGPTGGTCVVVWLRAAAGEEIPDEPPSPSSSTTSSNISVADQPGSPTRDERSAWVADGSSEGGSLGTLEL